MCHWRESISALDTSPLHHFLRGSFLILRRYKTLSNGTVAAADFLAEKRRKNPRRLRSIKLNADNHILESVSQEEVVFYFRCRRWKIISGKQQNVKNRPRMIENWREEWRFWKRNTLVTEYFMVMVFCPGNLVSPSEHNV